jgi:kynurenine 3-monooxygenase
MGHCSHAGLVASYDDLPEQQQEERLARLMPGLPAVWRREIAAQTGSEAQPPSSFGRIVRCSRFHGPRAVLLGDAAHCITSTLGQVPRSMPCPSRFLACQRLPNDTR